MEARRRQTARLRVSRELAELVRRTAAHTGLEEATIFRACALYLRRGKRSTKKIDKMYYSNNRVVKSIRNFTLPVGVTATDFRKTLAGRCLDALNKPSGAMPVRPEQQGVDYIVIEEN
jgi:integrase